MADDQTTQQQPTGDTPADTDTLTVGSAVPYNRFREVNTKYRAAEKELAELRGQLANPQPPAEDYRERYETAAAEIAAMKLARMRDRLVHERGLPLGLGDRLQGTTEADLSEDLDRLLALGFGGPMRAPNIGATDRNDAPTGFSLSQISDPAFFRANEGAIMQAQRDGRIFG